MSTTTVHTIAADGCSPIVRDHKAGGAISPGHLVEPTPSSTTTPKQCRVHATAGGSAAVLIALEDDLQGKTVDDAYATGDNVKVGAFHSGQRFYGRVSNGVNVTYGAKLESAGDGTWRLATADAASGTEVLAPRVWATEACDMSGSSGLDPAGGFCKMEVL